eukprot:augustus_masked-scaffold_7-processed-gene-4.59-mRNA-1 protein AED:1.00 eAED:1.00 QI:0/0/0/0/1/1/3/0/606
MQKDKTKGANLQPKVPGPEQQSRSELLGKWTATTYSTSEEMLEVITRLVSGRFKWKIHASHYFLTTEELKMIKHLGVADGGIAAADVALHRNFPGTLFDKELVKRIMKKAKEGVDASEDNNIKKLITCGKRCLERGGRFDLTWDYPKEGKAILNGVSFQEDLQNKLKKIYGDSIQVDTTHGMSRYRLVAMLTCGIDCFLKTINFLCTMMETESSKDVVKGLKLLGLQDAEAVMTDGSKALEAAVEELGSSHVLCRKHFLATLNSAASGLKGMKKIKFTNSLGDVLTGIFSEEKELDQLIENMLIEYPEEPQQVALKKLRKKNKVCWEMTRKLPTFSRSATQRVESFHSAIKGNGSLKSTLKTWTLDEVVTYHENNVDKYMERTLKKIKDLIREDKDFSKEADETFTKELKLMGACWIVEELSSRKFIVSDSNMRIRMKHVLEVVEREGVKLQSCACETWTNLRFPCRHYARYCDRKMIKYMDIDHLPARWRYQEHPLFKQALREMGEKSMAHPEAKYSKLLTACKVLCEEAKSSNKCRKKSYAAVLKMTAVLRENPDGDFGDLDEVSEGSGIMFESPRKRIKRRKGKGENVVSPLDFSQTTLLTDE